MLSRRSLLSKAVLCPVFCGTGNCLFNLLWAIAYCFSPSHQNFELKAACGSDTLCLMRSLLQDFASHVSVFTACFPIHSQIDSGREANAAKRGSITRASKPPGSDTATASKDGEVSGGCPTHSRWGRSCSHGLYPEGGRNLCSSRDQGHSVCGWHRTAKVTSSSGSPGDRL